MWNENVFASWSRIILATVSATQKWKQEQRWNKAVISDTVFVTLFPATVPTVSPFRGGDVAVYVFDVNQLSLPAPFYSVLVCFCLYGPFNCLHSINSPDSSPLSHSSSDLKSALLVLSAIYLFMKAPLSPDIIFCGWLGLKHQLTN